MTKIIHFNISEGSVEPKEDEEWVSRIVNLYTDTDVSAVRTTENLISFKTGLSGMDDTTGSAIKQRTDECLARNEAFSAQSTLCG